MWLFLTAGFLVIATRLQEAYITFSQGAQLYVTLSRILLINGLIYAVVLPLGTLAAGLPGLLAAAIGTEILKGLWMLHSGKSLGIRAGLGFDRAIFKRSMGCGSATADGFFMINGFRIISSHDAAVS